MMTLAAADQKLCTGPCGRPLPLSAFPPDRRRAGRLKAKCRDCEAAAARRRRSERSDFQQRDLLRQAFADLAADGLKRCGNPECLLVQPMEEFYRDRRRLDGRYNYCKSCCVRVDAARRPPVPPAPLSMTYAAVHSRLPSLAGLNCCRCSASANEWAYDHSDPAELVSPERRPYSLDQARYKPMCRRCHRRYDSEYRQPERQKRIAARPVIPRNACVICGSWFWAPARRVQSCSTACESALRARRQHERHGHAVVANASPVTPTPPLLSKRVARELAALAGMGGPQ